MQTCSAVNFCLWERWAHHTYPPISALARD